MDLDHRGAHILANLEAHGYHGTTTLGGRVSMTHSGDFHQNAFQRLGDQTGNLFGRGPRVLHKHIDHRHRDLRVFLPGSKHEADQTNEQCHDKYHGCHRGGDKQPCRSSRNPQ